MAAGHLVAFLELALGGDEDLDDFLDAGRQVVVRGALEALHVDDRALDAVGDAQARVAHVLGLLAEDRVEELELGRGLGLALGRDLADEDVAGLDLGADADDALDVEVVEALLAGVRDVARDALGAQLGLADLGLELLDVDGGEHVLLDHALGDEDGVLVVVAVPGHEAGEDVAPEGELAVPGRGAVGDDLSLEDLLALLDDGALGVAGILVGALVLHEDVLVARLLVGVGLDEDVVGVDVVDDAVAAGLEEDARVVGALLLHARADARRLGEDEGHGLALHVRAHEGAVGVVVLEEGDEGRGDRDDLLGRDVHVLELVGRAGRVVALVAAGDRRPRGSCPPCRSSRSPGRRSTCPRPSRRGTRSAW